MDRTEERRSRVTVKKLDMNSPDFHEENMPLTEGTPKECWDTFWALVPIFTKFSRGNIDFSKPIQRNVARKTNWAERKKEATIESEVYV